MPGATEPLQIPIPLEALGLEPFEFVLLALTATAVLLCVLFALGSPSGSQLLGLAVFFLIDATLLFLIDNMVAFYCLWQLAALFAWAVGQNALPEEERTTFAVPIQLAGAVASLAMIFTFIALRLANADTFSIEDLRANGTEWGGPLLLVALLLQLLALAGYSWRGGRQPLAGASAAFVMTAGAYVVCIYPFVKLVLGIYGAQTSLAFSVTVATLELSVPAWRDLALLIGLLGAALLGLAAIGEQDVRRIASYVVLGQLLLIVASLSQPNPQSMTAGVLLLAAYTFSCLALFVALGTVAVQSGAQRLSDLGGLAAVAPGGAALFAVAGLALVGLPPLGPFFGQTLLLGSLARLGPVWPVVAYFSALAFAMLALFRLMRGVFLGEAIRPSLQAAAVPVGTLGVAVLCILVVAMAFASFAPFWAAWIVELLTRTMLR